MHPLKPRSPVARAGVAVAGMIVASIIVASCDSTQLTTTSNDRIVPQVSLSVQSVRSAGSTIDSVNVRTPLLITVSANDNAAIRTVVTRVTVEGQQLAKDSAVFTVASSTYQKTLSIPLAGVLPGQHVSV